MSFLGRSELLACFKNRTAHDLDQSTEIQKTSAHSSRRSSLLSKNGPLDPTKPSRAERKAPDRPILSSSPSDLTPVVYVLLVENSSTGFGSEEETHTYTGVFSSLTRANANAELLAYRAINHPFHVGQVDTESCIEYLPGIIARERAEFENRRGKVVEREMGEDGCLRLRTRCPESMNVLDERGPERECRVRVERARYIMG